MIQFTGTKNEILSVTRFNDGINDGIFISIKTTKVYDYIHLDIETAIEFKNQIAKVIKKIEDGRVD